jgi:hypothetical protein
MDLIQLGDKLLCETLVEDDVAFKLVISFSLRQRLQEHELLLSNFVLEVLTHDVSQESAQLDLHLFGDCPDVLVIHEQVLLD